MANSSIFAQYLTPPKSVIDYGLDMDRRDLFRTQLEGAQRKNALANLTYGQQVQDAQAKAAETNAIRQIAAQSGGDRTKFMQGLEASGMPGLIGQAQAMRKQDADTGHVLAQTNQANAAAGKTQTETVDATIKRFRGALDYIDTPQGGARWLQAQYADPILGQHMQALAPLDQALQRIPTDPAQFQQWRERAGMGMEAYAKKVQEDAKIAETGRHNVADERISVSNNAATNATSRANNAANIGKDLTIAGMSPDGKPSDNVEQMAQAIARGAAAPITGFALAKPQGQTVMRRVFEINPQYDETTYAAKMKGAKDFGTGSQGNAMRSFAVAGQHLDQLGQLVDGLNNGNMQIVNKLGNMYAEQTGSAAPTNFDAAKDVVSKEVVKAIVAGGGGVAERQELADLMSKAKSPAQLKGVITQYRNLMAAQHEALLQQRRAAGLSDSTLPNYGPSADGGSSLPPDVAAALKKHGGQ